MRPDLFHHRKPARPPRVRRKKHRLQAYRALRAREAGPEDQARRAAFERTIQERP
jgi:hypothetical protein